jgi:hypothetical protein
MNVDIKMTGIEEALKKFDPDKVRQAANSALNKTASQAKTQVSKQIREEYNIPANKLNQFLRISSRARGNVMEAVISGIGRGLALAVFGAVQAGVQITKRGMRYTKNAIAAGRLAYSKVGWYTGIAGGQVTVEVKKGSRKPVTGDPKPFMTRTKSGHIGIFQREGESRLPIKQLLGPGIALLFGSKKIMDNTVKFINEKFKQIFEHEIDYYLNKK